MQASCTKETNRHRSQHTRHDEVWRDFAGHGVLVSRLKDGKAELEEFPDVALGWFDPAGSCKPEQKNNMQAEQTKGERQG